MASASNRLRPTRNRPPYMQIFIDLLRQHNEQQPQYAPRALAAEPIVSPMPLTAAGAEKLSTRLMKLLAESSARNTIARTASDSQNAAAAAAAAEELSSSQRDVISATQEQHSTTGSKQGPSSSAANKRVRPSTPIAKAANNTTSGQFNTPSPELEQQPIFAVKLVPADERESANKSAAQDILLANQLERFQLEEISELLAQQRQRNLEQLNQLQPDVQEQQQLQQQEQAEISGRNMRPPASPAARPPRAAVLQAKAKLIKATKDSTAPSLTQTPTAAVGTASSAAQTAAGKQLGPKPNQKKISMSKIIAEQTPTAFKTLVNVKNPGEHSGPGIKASGASSIMEAVPSDYEHIFHCPSNMPEEPRAGTKVRFHDKRQQQQQVKEAKNHKQNKKPKRHGRHQDNNKKAK